jgi:hypothetical protein
MDNETKFQAKEEWAKPELIVLVRNKPEEAVLMVCKAPGDVTPSLTATDCWYTTLIMCTAIASS